MIVKAVKRGYYGDSLREPGAVFELTSPAHFSDSRRKGLQGPGWMTLVEASQEELAAIPVPPVPAPAPAVKVPGKLPAPAGKVPPAPPAPPAGKQPAGKVADPSEKPKDNKDVL